MRVDTALHDACGELIEHINRVRDRVCCAFIYCSALCHHPPSTISLLSLYSILFLFHVSVVDCVFVCELVSSSIAFRVMIYSFMYCKLTSSSCRQLDDGVAWSIIIIMFQPCALQANDFVERCSIDMLSESNRAAPEVDARRVATLTRVVMADSSTHGARARARDLCVASDGGPKVARLSHIAARAIDVSRERRIGDVHRAPTRRVRTYPPPNCVPSRARANPPPPPETRARRVERSRAC